MLFHFQFVYDDGTYGPVNNFDCASFYHKSDNLNLLNRDPRAYPEYVSLNCNDLQICGNNMDKIRVSSQRKISVCLKNPIKIKIPYTFHMENKGICGFE